VQFPPNGTPIIFDPRGSVGGGRSYTTFGNAIREDLGDSFMQHVNLKFDGQSADTWGY